MPRPNRRPAELARGRVRASLLVPFLAIAAAPPTDEAQAESPLERGHYLVRIMDCGGCHTPGALAGQPDMDHPLSGSDVGFQIPDLGIFYPPNLTPDLETGLGGWSEEQIVAAVTRGERPDGRQLAPIMPWHAYSALNEEDARALAAYLESLAPAHETPDPVGPSERPRAPYLTLVVLE